MSLKNLILSQSKIAIDKKSAFSLNLTSAPRIVKDFNIGFLFKYYNPDLTEAISKPPQKYKVDPLLPPFDPNLFITQTEANYFLVNKFMHMPGHIVISSKDPKDQQGQPATLKDFIDIEKILNSFQCGIAYYNSGIESGCTQLHKHLQFAPLTKTPLLDAMAEKRKLPFVYRVEKFEGNTKFNASNIERAFLELTKTSP